MPIIFNHFWIMFIAVTIVNGLIWKNRSKQYIAEKPERKEGYNSLIRGFLIYGNIPWVIMGIGMLTGMTHSIFEFFNPSQMKPIVTLFFLSIIFLWIRGAYWIYFKGGAEYLVDHPGLITHAEKGNEQFEIMKVKLIWGIGILCGIIGMYMMYTQDFPTFVGQ